MHRMQGRVIDGGAQHHQGTVSRLFDSSDRLVGDQTVFSSRFSEDSSPEAKGGCSGPFRFPAREQTVASRAMLASHFALRGGAPDRVACWSLRLDS